MGMMMTSSFLSMWLSNTATTAMMLPIANAILESLFGDMEELKEKCNYKANPEVDVINGTLKRGIINKSEVGLSLLCVSNSNFSFNVTYGHSRRINREYIAERER